jgi:GH24 family phage-related lysozyme (muramidase)
MNGQNYENTINNLLDVTYTHGAKNEKYNSSFVSKERIIDILKTVDKGELIGFTPTENGNFFLELVNEGIDDGEFGIIEGNDIIIKAIKEHIGNNSFTNSDNGKSVSSISIAENSDDKGTYKFYLTENENGEICYKKIYMESINNETGAIDSFYITPNDFFWKGIFDGDTGAHNIVNFGAKDGKNNITGTINTITDLNLNEITNKRLIAIKYLFKEDRSFDELFTNQGILKYLFFCFSDDKNNYSVFKVEINPDKYFFPFIPSWVKWKEGKEVKEPTTFTFEYEEKENKIIKINKYYTYTYKVENNISPKSLSDKLIGCYQSSKSVAIKSNVYWATQNTQEQKPIYFMAGNFDYNNSLYYYNIEYISEDGTSFKENVYEDTFLSQNYRNFNYEEGSFTSISGNSASKGDILYQVNFKVPDNELTISGNIIKYYNRYFYDSLNYNKISSTNGTWNTLIGSNALKDLKQQEGFVPYFYLCPTGALTIGYGHTYAMSKGEDMARFDNFVNAFNNENYNIRKLERKNGHYRLLYNASLDEPNIYNADGSLKIEHCNKDGYLVNSGRHLQKFITNYDKNLYEISEAQATQYLINDVTSKAYRTYASIVEAGRITQVEGYVEFTEDSWGDIVSSSKWYDIAPRAINKKHESDILRNLTQEQFDTLTSITFQGNGEFWHSVRSYIQSKNVNDNYKVFCDAVKSTAENLKGNKSKALRNDEFRNKVVYLFSEIEDWTEENEEIIDEKIIKQIKVIAYSEANLKLDSKLKKDKILEDGGFTNTTIVGENEGYKNIVYYVTVEKQEKIDTSTTTEESENNEEVEQVNWEEEKNFINKWSVTNDIEKNIDQQYFLDVKNYYDLYSGMSPFVEVRFRDGTSGWNTINSVDHPYIQSLQIEDTGVKKAKLQLFDKDFASYQFGVLKGFGANVRSKEKNETDEAYNKLSEFERTTSYSMKEQVYSLDTLIKRSLITPSSKNTNKSDNTKYENETTLGDKYLEISNYETSVGPGNLKIRFGYIDNCEPLKDASLKKYMQEKIGNTATNNRSHRWWDVATGREGNSSVVKWKHRINGETLEEKETELSCNEPKLLNPDATGGLEKDVKRNSFDQTTTLSYLTEYMIVGYKSTLKKTGILYEIDAIETKNVEVMKKRFLQRYSEITTYPLEVLYILMRIFNENYNGKVLNSTGIKLIYLNDNFDYETKPSDSFNMDYDFSNAKKEEIQNIGDVKDLLEASKRGLKIDDKFLKKINLSFGGDGALRNYSSSNSDKPPLYKSLESLLNEFCAACPPRREYVNKKETDYDKDGNEIISEESKPVSKLKWLVAKNNNDKNDLNIYIVFYYQKVRKIKNIRRYIWGPTNPLQTVVKDLQIQNNNEFALLSSVTSTTFNGNNFITRTVVNNSNSESQIGDGTSSNIETTMKEETMKKNIEDEKIAIPVTYIEENIYNGNDINAALANSMYAGTMSILGDPSLEFDMTLQPYMYPIYLEVLVPMNDLIAVNKDIGDKIKEYDKKFKMYKTSRVFNNGEEYSGNQRTHEMSGYYVLTSITHNISSSGYTTTLGVSRYPNIEKDVLLTNKNNEVIKYPKVKTDFE